MSNTDAAQPSAGARDEDFRPAHTMDEYEGGSPRNPGDDVFSIERPWGRFQQFVSNEQVTVKLITVSPGHRLSLQRHEHRGEMWQILDVPIDIVLDDRSWTAQPGETVWVPAGAAHRMGNSGSAAGRLLEVGFGHFDERDIERLEDDYARHDQSSPEGRAALEGDAAAAAASGLPSRS